MKKLLPSILLTLMLSFNLSANVQDIQIFSSNNSDGQITKKSIEDAFKKEGFRITGNNGMHKIFKGLNRPNYYDSYRLMFIYNPVLASKLAVDYPNVGLITNISTSVYSQGDVVKIATLTLKGMSKLTNIPIDNKVLIDIYNNLNGALKRAMPNGDFDELNYTIEKPIGPLMTSLTIDLDFEGEDMEDVKDSFQEDFENEIESQGFVVSGFVNFNHSIVKENSDVYDFYDTYSICNLDVIYPLHKNLPEVGAFAPCTMYMYKKKNEQKTHIVFPSVYNWISSVDIKDKHLIKALLDAQLKLEEVFNELIDQ